MKKLLIIFVLITTNIIFSQDDNYKEFFKENNRYPSFCEILSNPDEFDNRLISFVGVFSKNGYLFFTKDDEKYSILRNSFKMDISNFSQEEINRLDGKFVLVYGVFQKKNSFLYSGTIWDIKNFSDLEDLLFQRKIDEYIIELEKKKK